MQTKRFLLPFTHGVNMFALENAVQLAKTCDAILVPLALIHIPQERQKKGARLEHIQQAKDFLEAAKYKALKYNVPVERYELFTSDVVESIDAIVKEIECDAVLLFLSGQAGILLQIDEIKRLVEMEAWTLYVFRMPSVANKDYIQVLRRRVSNWLTRGRRQQVEPLEAHNRAVGEVEQPVEEISQPAGVKSIR